MNKLGKKKKKKKKKKQQSPVSETETVQPWNQISDNRAYKQTTDRRHWDLGTRFDIARTYPQAPTNRELLLTT